MKVKNVSDNQIGLYEHKLYVGQTKEIPVWDDQLLTLIKQKILVVVEGDLYEKHESEGYQGNQERKQED